MQVNYRWLAAGGLLLSIAMPTLCLATPHRHAGTAHALAHSTRDAFLQKDEEIASLRSQIVYLKANITSLEQQLEKRQSAANTASNQSDSETVAISNVHAQRFEKSDAFGDTMWLVTFDISNKALLPVTAPTVYLEYSDRSSDMLLPYASQDAYTIEVGKPSTIRPLSTATLKYFWNGRNADRTPVSALFQLGTSHLTLPVNVHAPNLVAGK